VGAYRTRTLFTERTYTRTLEGSACVLLSGILAVFLMRGQLSLAQLIPALAVSTLAVLELA
jgi:hypothetical protein